MGEFDIYLGETDNNDNNNDNDNDNNNIITRQMIKNSANLAVGAFALGMMGQMVKEVRRRQYEALPWYKKLAWKLFGWRPPMRF